MFLKIIETTDNNHVGVVIDTSHSTIQLSDDTTFSDYTIRPISPGVYRLFNTNYVIDAKEID